MEACIKAAVWGENDPHDYTRLLGRLNGGLSCRLILIFAPAKSGKTKLLQHWIQHGIIPKGYRVIWFDLNNQNNQPETFLTNLTSALQADTTLEENTLLKHENKETFYLEDRFVELINALAITPGETFVILDNYHLITAPEIHKGIGLMLEYLPPQAHIVIASQTEPPLPIARLRARRQVMEIGPVDF